MAKRANGEGSIFKRKDGTWSAELSYRDDYGILKRRTVYGRTQAEHRRTAMNDPERSSMVVKMVVRNAAATCGYTRLDPGSTGR